VDSRKRRVGALPTREQLFGKPSDYEITENDTKADIVTKKTKSPVREFLKEAKVLLSPDQVQCTYLLHVCRKNYIL
jgi:hypothetical protein